MRCERNMGEMGPYMEGKGARESGEGKGMASGKRS